MKLSEFMLLDEAGKRITVINNGIPLASITNPGFIIFLFQMENFYVETYCNTSDNSIEEYRVLPGTNSLKRYLDAIPIDDLLN
ncbi:MAG TPA: hypothetical protein PKM63_16160 [Panacibacter sp.]|nr:hypothetical protein [Panacibacter sp.]HNP45827.1 hypothetical protein [Panacibacter sp.]